MISTYGGNIYRYASRLNAGAKISAQHFISFTPQPDATNPVDRFDAVSMAAFNGYPNTMFGTAGLTGFIGFKFDVANGTQYGWVRINVDTGAPTHEFTVVDYASGDPGQRILTGQTSVPDSGGSLGLLAIGCAGLLAWRAQRAGATA